MKKSSPNRTPKFHVRRAALACSQCRRSKTRCHYLNNGQTCFRCTNLGIRCSLADVNLTDSLISQNAISSTENASISQKLDEVLSKVDLLLGVRRAAEMVDQELDNQPEASNLLDKLYFDVTPFRDVRRAGDMTQIPFSKELAHGIWPLVLAHPAAADVVASGLLSESLANELVRLAIDFYGLWGGIYAAPHNYVNELRTQYDPAVALRVNPRCAADKVPDPGVSADCAFFHLAVLPGFLLRRLVSVRLRAAPLHHARDGPQPVVGPVQDAPGPHREFPALEPARAHASVLLPTIWPAVSDRHFAARPVPEHPGYPVGLQLRRPHRQPALYPAHPVQRAAVQGAARNIAQGPQVVVQRLEASSRAGHRRPGDRDHLPLLQGDAVPQSVPDDAGSEIDPGPGHRVREVD
ncbi:hypothetical protein KL907_004146 [Ogataea polymorpha]|nr:hypothetical protein KL907_004146 [Ogataea polymorpha]